MLSFLLLSCDILNIVLGGYPISDPSATTLESKQTPYNLIDTDPSCFHSGFCPMFVPGSALSTFPNSEEKFQQILHNLHRMFANQSLGTDLGHWFYGANEAGGATFFCKSGCTYCGTTHPNRRPLYWYSDANQMARFKQWDENTCDQSWYDQPGESAHSTCGAANTSLPQWRGFQNGILTVPFRGQTYKTGTNRCCLFGVTPNPSSSPTNPTPFNEDCSFAGRAGKFCHDTKDRCWFETEGICGGNTCLFDPHCEPIFANKYDYVGKGFVENMNGVGHVYSRFTKEIYYPLPIGTHYDERWKIHPDDRSNINKYFVLMLEYFDYNKTQTPSNCYALYNGQYTEMNVYLSNHPYDGGSYSPGSYDNNDYSVIFKSNFIQPTPDCSPYAFICKTSLGNFFRLPEETIYYFGTEWMEWVWSDFKNEFGYNCKENHYYRHNTEGWTVNGGPTLTKSDIWYYQDTINYGSCIGCQYIDILECWERCIRFDFQSSECQCSSSPSAPTTTAPTTTAPTTTAPTATAPTTKTPTTKAPTTKTPTTRAPTTTAPTATAPTTKTPTTKAPTTTAPTTSAPTTKSPTNEAPTTKTPTTTAPTTTAPTTKTPTTTAPTTTAPTTKTPTTKSPTNTAKPSSVPSNNPTIITVSPSDITSSPTFITISPTLSTGSPTDSSLSPSESPTDLTISPSLSPTTSSPTVSGQTCITITWSYRWSRISSWNEGTMGATYREVAEELFIDTHPNCGQYNSETLEYYYYFKWWGLGRPNKKKLDIYLIVCCGDGMTFGPNYDIPADVADNEMYQRNAVLIEKYGDQGFEHNDASWTEPNKFGIKQYIVFGIIGLIILCCCGVCIYCGKYYYYTKKGKVEFGSNDTGNYLSNFPNKSRGSKKNLADTIQMGAMSRPGPKHVALPSHGRDSTDGSTEGDNKYQGQFIHTVVNHNDSDSHHGFTTNLSPPIQLMGHAVMPSQSVDDDVDDDDDDDNHNVSGGLPPPSTSIDDQIHQLNDQDISNAFQ